MAENVPPMLQHAGSSPSIADDRAVLDRCVDTSAQYYDTTSSVLPPRSRLGSSDALHTPRHTTHKAAVGHSAL